LREATGTHGTRSASECASRGIDPDNVSEVQVNWDQVRGNWNQAKGDLKVRWARLTDDDLGMIEGERDKLVGRLQELYGLSKEEAERQVEDL
jgi:uncharacterized protein YjbJ (UPF0337 family)